MNNGLEALDKIIDMALEPNGYQNFTNGCDKEYYQIIEKELKENEQYKVIEEELGISFKVFIEAMLHGICIRINDGIMDFNNVVGWLWRFDRNPNYVGTERPLEYHFDIILGNVKSFYLKDYGKTWALTKKELE